MFKNKNNGKHFETLNLFWSRLGHSCPFINFNKNWNFKLIAPTNTQELIRMLVAHKDFPNNPCSIILCNFDNTCFWEVYPAEKLKSSGQLTYSRCDVNNIRELKKLISLALKNTTNNFGRNRLGIKKPRKNKNDGTFQRDSV